MHSCESINVRVNGVNHSLQLPSGVSLLHVLRHDLRLNGPKYGCGLGQCGACTVLIDGKAARSCVLPVAGLEGHPIVTLEGLSVEGELHPVQAAFVALSGTQCGYCLNGMIMTLAAFLPTVRHPSESQVKEALRFNLCRCGSHVEVVQAAMKAAASLQAATTVEARTTLVATPS
jgi:nicotinate dehydrogenase subunit A